MGTTTNAILFYGFAAHSDADNEAPMWLDDCEGFFEADDRWEWVLDDIAKRHLGREPDGWGEQSAALKALGVEVDYHCHADYAMAFVAALGAVFTCNRGNVVDIDSLNVQDGWGASLLGFCRLMGIDTEKVKIGWHLVSYWG